jgi:hypothetical protein
MPLREHLVFWDGNGLANGDRPWVASFGKVHQQPRQGVPTRTDVCAWASNSRKPSSGPYGAGRTPAEHHPGHSAFHLGGSLDAGLMQLLLLSPSSSARSTVRGKRRSTRLRHGTVAVPCRRPTLAQMKNGSKGPVEIQLHR